MKDHLDQLDETLTEMGSPRRELAEVLEQYLADLERGTPTDRAALLAAHPDLADELRPYLDSIDKLHAATQDLRVTRSLDANAGPAATGKRIGDFRIVREVGRGGMGVVYEAHQESLNRRVALKILPFAAVLDPRQIARFRNEAQAAAQLHHPHIVPVFAVGQENGVYYYAMQFVDGQSLEEAMRELRSAGRSRHGAIDPGPRRGQRLDGDDGISTRGQVLSSHGSVRDRDFFLNVARLGKEAAEALQHAHEYGILHRDVKPSNLMVDLAGQTVGHRLRPGTDSKRQRRDAHGRRRRNAALHEPRAGFRQGGLGRCADRRLFARRHALRTDHAAARVSGRRSARGVAANRARRADAAATSESGRAGRSRDDRAHGDGQVAGRSLRLGPGARGRFGSIFDGPLGACAATGIHGSSRSLGTAASATCRGGGGAASCC